MSTLVTVHQLLGLNTDMGLYEGAVNTKGTGLRLLTAPGALRAGAVMRLREASCGRVALTVHVARYRS